MLTPFKRLFAPPFRSPMPNFLDFRNPWGKKWKEVVSDLKTFAQKGCKIAPQKKFAFLRSLPYKQDFFGLGATIRIG